MWNLSGALLWTALSVERAQFNGLLFSGGRMEILVFIAKVIAIGSGLLVLGALGLLIVAISMADWFEDLE